MAFMRFFVQVHAIAWGMWGIAIFIIGLFLVLDKDWAIYSDRFGHLIWLIWASSVYVLGFFLLRYPYLFHKLEDLQIVKQETPTQSQKDIPLFAVDKTATSLAPPLDVERVAVLEHVMQTKRPYLNPTLSMTELAQMADIPVHQLSRLINESFDKNFFDYINSYRIEEFKQRILKGEHQQHTILSIAFEAGFNSKTAFNRAFKKHTGMTPREFLQHH